MIPRPQFKPWFRVTAVPGEGVCLLSEHGHSWLRGKVYFQLAPLLNGQHTVEEIISCLQDQFPASEIFSALMSLRGRGYLIDEPPYFPPEQSAFWDRIEGSAKNAAHRLQEVPVSVISYDGIDSLPFRTILTSLGARVVDDGDYWVVLTRNYLHQELEAFNQHALANDRPWLLVKPVGMELWFGPLFLPGQTACWQCLAHRLRGARKVEHFLQEKLGAAVETDRPTAALPSTLQTALNIAATETAKWIVCGRNEALEGRVVSLNTLSWERQSHTVVRRPQCSHCGDPSAFASGQVAPLILQSRKKVFTSDGGHRILSPEETLRKLSHHVSPITGIVSTLEPTTKWMGERGLVLSYVTGHNFVHASKDYAWGLEFLEATLRDASAGKGVEPVQAKASALCEAIERYSGVFQGDEARIRASLEDLDDAAIHPNACMLFSGSQIAQREEVNAISSPPSWVPEPFDSTAIVDWSPVWSLTHGMPRYVPTAYCYYGYSRKHNVWFARADSNGCAAGHSKEEAILQGFMELVERDCVALWWYNRLQKPAVDLSSFHEPYFEELSTYYQTLRRDLWVLDITSDLDIPTFAAVSRRNDKETQDILLGFGAHFDPSIAILRALTEVNQSLPIVSSETPGRHYRYPDSEAVSWWTTATCQNQPYLLPDETLGPRLQANYANRWSDDLRTDVMACVDIAGARGLETLVLDQTRPDTGLYVVKVIVPGLRHFWPRFAPGRLYEIPVQMGWLAEPLPERRLNPQHIFF